MNQTETFAGFQNQIIRQIKKKDAALCAEPVRVPKNNGVIRRGIRIFREKEEAAPALYLETFYQEYLDGRTIGSIAGELLRCYEQCRIEEPFQASLLRSYETVRSRIVYRLVNYARNRKELEQMPHIRFLDLAVIFACRIVHDSVGAAAFRVTEEHRRIWETDTDGLLREAVANTPRHYPPRLADMTQVLQEILRDTAAAPQEAWEKETLDALPMELSKELYVFGNGDGYYGAGAILYPGALAEAGETLGRNFFILPSSVHEVILVPDKGREETAAYEAMVREINRAHLEPEDILSDSVYYYDRAADRLTLAGGSSS